jgi:hypothetical protein
MKVLQAYPEIDVIKIAFLAKRLQVTVPPLPQSKPGEAGAAAKKKGQGSGSKK